MFLISEGDVPKLNSNKSGSKSTQQKQSDKDTTNYNRGSLKEGEQHKYQKILTPLSSFFVYIPLITSNATSPMNHHTLLTTVHSPVTS